MVIFANFINKQLKNVLKDGAGQVGHVKTSILSIVCRCEKPSASAYHVTGKKPFRIKLRRNISIFKIRVSQVKNDVFVNNF